MKYPVTFMVVAEPSMFRRHETEVRYFATLKRARKWSKRYVRKNPCGEGDLHPQARLGPVLGGQLREARDEDHRVSVTFVERPERLRSDERIGPAPDPSTTPPSSSSGAGRRAGELKLNSDAWFFYSSSSVSRVMRRLRSEVRRQRRYGRYCDQGQIKKGPVGLPLGPFAF